MRLVLEGPLCRPARSATLVEWRRPRDESWLACCAEAANGSRRRTSAWLPDGIDVRSDCDARRSRSSPQSRSTTTSGSSRDAGRARHPMCFARSAGHCSSRWRSSDICTSWLGGPAEHRSDRRLGISPAIAQLLDRFEDAAVTVCDAALDIIASNNLGTALVGDLSGASPDERNVVWRFFMRPGARDRHDPATAEQLAAELVSDLRMVAARQPGDSRIGGLIERLRAGSDEFRELWEYAPVVAHRSSRKRIDHPVVGWLDLDCTSLHDPDRDQLIVIHTAQIGSPSHEAIQLLKVLGTQRMSSQSG